jgi:hypothetical protein
MNDSYYVATPTQILICLVVAGLVIYVFLRRADR